MGFLDAGYEGFCAAVDAVETPVLFCERFDEQSDIWNFAKHKHGCIELLYFLYGNAEVITPGSSVQASFYDTIIYPKGMYHTECLQFNHHQEIICVWVDIPGLDIPNVIRIQDKDANLKWLLESLYTEYKREAPAEALIRHYVKSIAMLIARECMQKDDQSDMVSRVILYIQDHMAEAIEVQTLADLVYVSRSYLSRVFKQQVGMSLIEYQRALRVETAKAMLAASDMSAEDIACTIGYHSAKYFYRAFLACTGMSPREYRKREAKRYWTAEPASWPEDSAAGGSQ